MEIKFRANNPDEIDFTITATMSLYDWRRIAEALRPANDHPSTQLYYKIQEVVAQAETKFTPEETKE